MLPYAHPDWSALSKKRDWVAAQWFYFYRHNADVDVSSTPAVRRRGAPARTLIHDFIMGWMC